MYQIFDGKHIVDWCDGVIESLHSRGRRGLELELMAICFYYCSDGDVPVLKFQYKDQKRKYRQFFARKNGDDKADVFIDNRMVGTVSLNLLYEFMTNDKRCNVMYPFS
jgi:hypothetical protein